MRKRLLVGAGLLSCLTLTVFAISTWIPRSRPQTPIYQSGPVVNAIAFSRDRNARYVAAALSNGRVRLWEVGTKQELPVKFPSQLPLHDLAWSTDGVLLTGGFEQTVLAWTVKTSQAKKIPTFGMQIVSLACRPSSGEILVSLLNGQLFLLDPRSTARESLTTGHQGIVKVVRFAPEGDVFVTAGADGQLVWHEWKSKQVLRTVAAHQHEISSLMFSNNGLKVVSGSWDQTAKVWDNQSDKPLVTFNHTSEVAHVGWVGSEIVTSCWDERLRFWNPDTSSMTKEIPWNHGSLAFAINPGKSEVVGIDADGVWHTATP